MKQELKTIRHDEDLCLEAYCFQGISQLFPNHFHDYYVIGFMEAGSRSLTCRNKEYIIKKGDVLLFHPGENHGCAQRNGGTLDYRGINIPVKTMRFLTAEITGQCELLGFSKNVIADREVGHFLISLHQKIMAKADKFEKQELLFLLLGILVERYGQSFEQCALACGHEIQAACLFMETHYRERISLEQLCEHSNLSKSTLLRAFIKSKGVTPYRYLQSFRISRAKTLLEQGASPLEAALETGFADQSHFTNFFHQYIGLSPAAYRRMFQTSCVQISQGEQRHGR